MAKRTASEANPKAVYDVRQPKRQRSSDSLEHNPAPTRVAAVEVNSAHQLQTALVFEQGNATGFRSGLNLLKTFLDSILYSADEHDLPRKRAILREYLDTQKRERCDDKESGFLSNLTQGWEFAAETNFDALLTQITSNLALLFKVFSAYPEFAEYATLLSKAVLHPSLVRRLNRSLSGPPGKEAVISPILRLLTEITRLYEGAHARTVYMKKDFTLEPKILAKNIGLWRDSKRDSTLEQRKPSIRTNAIRYFLTHLKYQDERAKSDILENVNIIRAVFDHLSSDPPFLILEILDVLTNHVFKDKTISRPTKSRLLSGKALSKISALYWYQSAEESQLEGNKSPEVAVHEFLHLVCTSPEYGVMLPSDGFYPFFNNDDGNMIMEDTVEDMAEITLTTNESFEFRGRVRNVILGEFVRSLKPYANTMHQELAIAIFKACPELVTDYFLHKEAFHYDPNLTSTWMGYSSFLYQTIELPVPQFLGARRGYRKFPPPVLAVIQHVLPQPLNRQVLTRCLNHGADLVNLIAIRVLIVAFHKLRAILQQFHEASSHTSIPAWQQASKHLIVEFCRRCPQVKVVIKAFQRLSFQKGMMRETIARLLRLYYEVTPQFALQEKFDVSIPLCTALLNADKPATSPEDRAFRTMELEHWIQIARRSTDVRWWQKHKSLQYSPFMTLLKLVASHTEGELYNGIKTLLVAILDDHEMLQMSTHPNALETLIASLGTPCGSSSAAPQVLEFLDDCCARFVKAPIKYFDHLDTFRARSSRPDSAGPISPLLMTFIEQWPFKGGKSEKGNPAEPLAQWLSKLLYLMKLVGEDDIVLEPVRDSLVASADVAYQRVLNDSFLWKMNKEQAKQALKMATGADFSGSERSSVSPIPPTNTKQLSKQEPAANLELPPEEDEKHAGLNRWRRKDIEESIEDGDVGDLVLCLCSKHAEIRLQAAMNIRQLVAKIEASDNADLLQIRLLLGAILETTGSTLDSEPFPYVGGVFAARAVHVLTDPAHFLFPKINEFLIKGPTWQIANLPRHFYRALVVSAPEQDSLYHKQVDWYLDYVIDSLRTPTDMEIFRTRNIFEKLLSHYASTSCSISAKEKIVRLLFRAAAVGGSTTLVTRCGLIAWIQIRLDNNDHRRKMLKVLASRLYETCDREKVDEWSSGLAADSIASLVKCN